MDIQRLRNLTTRRLHTEMRHIYDDLETITGERGLMTHMLPKVLRSVEPWLREHIADPRFWNGEYDPAHVGEYEIPDPTADSRAAMLDRYMAQPDPWAKLASDRA